MDATEAQLKFGASLTNSLDLSSPSHPLNTGSNTGGGRLNVPAATLASIGVMAFNPWHAYELLHEKHFINGFFFVQFMGG